MSILECIFISCDSGDGFLVVCTDGGGGGHSDVDTAEKRRGPHRQQSVKVRASISPSSPLLSYSTLAKTESTKALLKKLLLGARLGILTCSVGYYTHRQHPDLVWGV